VISGRLITPIFFASKSPKLLVTANPGPHFNKIINLYFTYLFLKKNKLHLFIFLMVRFFFIQKLYNFFFNLTEKKIFNNL